MKRFYFQFRVMLITLALGLASPSFFNSVSDYLTEIPVDLPKVNSRSVFEIITKKNGARFESIGIACGGKNEYGGESWVIGYETNDWQRLSVSGSSHDSARETRQEIDLRIKDSVKVLDSAETFNKTSKFKEKRIVLENEQNGQKWIDILRYDGNKFIEITTAPSLELVLEFKKKLEESEKAR